jgi:HEAT repeat protein
MQTNFLNKEELEEYFKNNKSEFLNLIIDISNGSSFNTIYQTAIALELSGDILKNKAVPHLIKSLDSKEAIIREASVYGLSYNMENDKVYEALKFISVNDKSNSVKDAAIHALDTFKSSNGQL